MSESRVVVRGGPVIDGSGAPPRRADVAVRGARIEAVGTVSSEAGDEVIEADGRYVLPGFIDAHSHADAAVFDEEVQRALLRQGVTTVVAGQDGISYAPGDGGYGTDYFGALMGAHPRYTGGGVGALLACYDGSTRVNVGYLVPAGTVRHEVCGYRDGGADRAQRATMAGLVRTGLAEGALGMSTGLDYVPGKFQQTAELAALCREVAAAGALYVSHMRGGYETNAHVGVVEACTLATETGVSVHLSHYHGPADLLLPLVDGAAERGLDVTFDAYPYRRGASLLTMITLPDRVLGGPSSEVVAQLADPVVREDLLHNWFPQLDADRTLGPEWPDLLTFAHIAEPGPVWACGRTIRAAASDRSVSPAEFVIDVLVAAGLKVSMIATVRNQREYDDLARLFVHPAHMAGSDGIYIGQHPHPRAWGTFAKYLRVFTTERGDYSWPDVAAHLAGHTARRFGMADRGLLRPGFIADLSVMDPATVADTADYDTPRSDAVGVDDVLVGGRRVLADGRLTGALSGRGVRRSAPSR